MMDEQQLVDGRRSRVSGWQDEINPEPKRLLWTDEEYAQHLAALLHDACSRLEDAGEPITGALAVWWAEREQRYTIVLDADPTPEGDQGYDVLLDGSPVWWAPTREEALAWVDAQGEVES